MRKISYSYEKSKFSLILKIAIYILTSMWFGFPPWVNHSVLIVTPNKNKSRNISWKKTNFYSFLDSVKRKSVKSCRIWYRVFLQTFELLLARRRNIQHCLVRLASMQHFVLFFCESLLSSLELFLFWSIRWHHLKHPSISPLKTPRPLFTSQTFTVK